MKKRLLKILMLLFLIGNLTFSEYVVKDGKVFYNGKEVWVEDMKSFRILNDKIAADSQNIYFEGERTFLNSIEKLDMIEFEIENLRKIDKNKLYNIKKLGLILDKSTDKNFYISKPDNSLFIIRKESGKYRFWQINKKILDNSDFYYFLQDNKGFYVNKIKLVSSKVKDRDFYFLKYDGKIYGVYRDGYNEIDVDYESFEEISKRFVKSKDKVYYVGLFPWCYRLAGDLCLSVILDMVEIERVNPENFKVIADDFEYNEIFIENDNKLYFINRKDLYEHKFELNELKHIDLKTFKPLDYKFVKDKDNVYYLYGHNKFLKFEEADAKTFKIIDKGYTKDKNSIYFFDPYTNYIEPVKMDVDKNTFKLIKFGDTYIYRLYSNSTYARDKKNIYCEGRLLEDVDYKTFKVFKEKNENGEEVMKIKDKNHEYDEYCQIKDKNKF